MWVRWSYRWDACREGRPFAVLCCVAATPRACVVGSPPPSGESHRNAIDPDVMTEPRALIGFGLDSSRLGLVRLELPQTCRRPAPVRRRIPSHRSGSPTHHRRRRSGPARFDALGRGGPPTNSQLYSAAMRSQMISRCSSLSPIRRGGGMRTMRSPSKHPAHLIAADAARV
jgi:hypothetical protein